MDPFAFINRNVPDIPVHEGVEELNAFSHGDGSPIAGWSWKPKGQAKGTLFCLHGFSDNCRNSESWPHWIKLAAQHNVALVTFDFRHHGQSSDQWPSFGTGEAWDLLGVIDRAEELGFPQPFIISASSLGAMAAQRATVEDVRIKGCFLAEIPECPWHAVGSTIWNELKGMGKLLVPFGTVIGGNMINAYYRWQILTDGDVRRHPAVRNPSHQPLILFIMGTKDEFEIKKTRGVYDTWYADVFGVAGAGYKPHEEPKARKWFVEVDGASHSGRGNYCVYDWEHFGACQDSFMRRCLE